jgi:NADH-quinone oxidoreductase subunit N
MMIIFIYIVLVFTLFFILNMFNVKHFKNLSDFKNIGILFPINFLFLIVILSFAGVPPLFGFSIKLVIFLALLSSTSMFYVLILALFNFFTLYFYIQNVRFVINNSKTVSYVYVKHFAQISDSTLFTLSFGVLINLGGILLLSDIQIFFSNLII